MGANTVVHRQKHPAGWTNKMCCRCLLWLMPALVLLMALSGCLVQPDPHDVAAVSAYNNHIVDLLSPFITPVVTILGVWALWLRLKYSERELARRTEEAAQRLAAATEKKADELVHKTEAAAKVAVAEANERTCQVLTEVKEGLAQSAAAIEVANHSNEKIIRLQETVAEQTKRAPARSTDREDVMKVEIATGAGKDTPLKVKAEDGDT